MRHPVLEQQKKKKSQTEEQVKCALLSKRIKLECIIRRFLSKITGGAGASQVLHNILLGIKLLFCGLEKELWLCRAKRSKVSWYPGRGKEIKDCIICQLPLIWPVQRTGILSSPKVQAAIQTVHCCSLLFNHGNCIVNKMHTGLY